MSYVQTIIRRVVGALPVYSHKSIENLQADALLTASCVTLIDLSRELQQYEEVVGELLIALTDLCKSQTRELDAVERQRSQLFLLRIVSSCSIHVAMALKERADVHALSLLSTTVHDRAFACVVAITAQSPIIDRAGGEMLPQQAVPRLQRFSRLGSFTSTTRFELRSPNTVEVEEQRAHLQTLAALVSALNWPATFSKFVGMLQHPYLESFEEEYNQTLQCLSYVTLNLSKFDALLSMAARAWNTLENSSQMVLVGALVASALSWLRQAPQDVEQLYREPRRTVAPDVPPFFNLLLQTADTVRKKAHIWPLLAILLALNPGEHREPEKKPMKKALFIQTLSRSIGESRQLSAICFESYTRIFQATSHLDQYLLEPINPFITEVLNSVCANQEPLRECATQKDFTIVCSMFCYFFRMHHLRAFEFATSTIISWLKDEDENGHCRRILALKALTAIFTDPFTTSISGERAKIELKQLTSPLVLSVWSEITIAGYSLGENSPQLNQQGDLCQCILELLAAAPEIYLSDRGDTATREINQTLAFALFSREFTCESTAAQLTLEIHKEGILQARRNGSTTLQDSALYWNHYVRFVVETSYVLVDRITTFDWSNISGLRALLSFTTECLRGRNACLAKLWPRHGNEKDLESFMASLEQLGSAFLTLCCHLEVVVATESARACKLIAAEYDILSATGHAVPGPDDVYRLLALEDFPIIGKNAVQKRIRNCLRNAKSTPNLRIAWSAIYEPWCKLTDCLFADAPTLPGTKQDPGVQSQWQNYTVFLASAGRIDNTEDDYAVNQFFGRFRQIFLFKGETEFLTEFIADALGVELPASLIISVLQQVQILIATMKDSKGILIVRGRNTTLAEHMILICKGLFERLDGYPGSRDGLDIGSLILDLASYLELCGQQSPRSRLRFCQLCEVLAPRYDLLCIAGESSTRRRLCNHLASWVSDQDPHQPELQKIQKDTNSACIKALARLSNNMRLAHEPLSKGNQVVANIKGLLAFVLPLLPLPEGRKSRQFAKEDYLVLIRELLSNVLATNQRVAFTAFLSLCYHKEPQVQDLFQTIILARLAQGIESFRNPCDKTLRQDLWLMVSIDSDVMTAILDGCSADQHVPERLLKCFERRGTPQALFALVVKTEIKMCAQESELYRRNSPTTRLFATYARRYEGSYVEDILRLPIEKLASQPDDYSMELDIDKLRPSEDIASVLEQNRRNLQNTCQEFIDAICYSAPRLPRQLAQIMRIVADETSQKYPAAVQNSVGSFLILRLIGPAIMNHELSSRSSKMRRQVVLVVKLLTNLANNTYFKEAHMGEINVFLRSNIFKLSKFLSDISSVTSVSQDGRSDPYDPNCGVSEDEDGDLSDLYRKLYSSGDKIKSKLIEISLSQAISVAVIREKLRRFRFLVSHLGHPSDFVFAKSPMTTTSPTSSLSISSSQKSSLAFSAVKVDGVHALGLSQTNRQVLYFDLKESQSAHRGQELIEDFCATMISRGSQEYEIFIDVTGFQNTSHTQLGEGPLIGLLTDERVQSCHALYFYNTNSAFLTFFQAHICPHMSIDPSRTRFLDHGDNIGRYFDRVTCSRITARHGLLSTNLPNLLLASHAGQSGPDVQMRMSFHSNDVVFLSSTQKFEITQEHKARLVEFIPLVDIRHVQVTDGFLILPLKDSTVSRLATQDPSSVAAALKAAILQVVPGSQYEERTTENHEKILGLLLCLGLIRLGSPHLEQVEFGMKILRLIIPSHALDRVGVCRGSKPVTLFNMTDLRQIHEHVQGLSSKTAGRTLVVEMLSRLCHSSIRERQFQLRCLDLWLEDTIEPVGTYQVHQKSNYLETIVMCCVGLHIDHVQEELPENLWRILARQKTRLESLVEMLSTYAILFPCNSHQVRVISEILRLVRTRTTIRRLAEMLVVEIQSSKSTAIESLDLAQNWSELMVLLTLLAESTARTTEPVDGLPEILFAGLSLMKYGTADNRWLLYQLILNCITGVLCSDTISVSRREQMEEVLQAFLDSDIQDNFTVQTGSVVEADTREAHPLSDRNKELVAGDKILAVIEIFVDLMKLSSPSEEQEAEQLTDFARIVTEAAFQNSCLSKRSFLAVGVLSRECGVRETKPLIDALIQGLISATPANSRYVLAVFLCLSAVPTADICKHLKLAIAFCMLPASSLAASGLRVLGLCLQGMLDAGLSSQSIRDKLRPEHLKWSEYESWLGISISSRPSLGICSVLLHAAAIPENRDAVKRILLSLIKVFQGDRLSQPTEWIRDSLPPLLLLCSLSSNPSEMRSMMIIGGLDFSDEHPMRSLIPREIVSDRDSASLLVVLISYQVRAVSSEDQQAILLHALADTANAVPDTFSFVVDDLEPFLLRIVRESGSVRLLKSVYATLSSRKSIETSVAEQVQTPFSHARLNALGFSFLMRPIELQAELNELGSHKQFIIDFLREEC